MARPPPWSRSNGAPVVRVAAGSHAIAGTFSWARRPELLAVPASVALLQLSVDGARVALPQRSSAGVVLGAQAVAREDNRLEVRVFRLLADSLPASLTTQIQLVVAGEGREIRLPQVLPQGFIPTSVDGPLAARLDPDNTLRVQVRPGEFELTIEARGPSPATEVHLGALPAPWPADEIWSFQAQDRLRVVTLEGVAAVDPAQANVPPDWRELPAYRMNPGTVLRLTERSRGMSVADANQLQLLRTMWLDFSGAGYTVVDRISGQHAPGLAAGDESAVRPAERAHGGGEFAAGDLRHGPGVQRRRGARSGPRPHRGGAPAALGRRTAGDRVA